MRSRQMVGVTGAAVLAIGFASPVWAEVKDASPEGFTLENTVRVPVDAETAWQALVEDVDTWWPPDHTWWGAESALSIEARAGGCFCERKGDAEAQHMLVTARRVGGTSAASSKAARCAR